MTFYAESKNLLTLISDSVADHESDVEHLRAGLPSPISADPAHCPPEIIEMPRNPDVANTRGAHNMVAFSHTVNSTAKAEDSHSSSKCDDPQNVKNVSTFNASRAHAKNQKLPPPSMGNRFSMPSKRPVAGHESDLENHQGSTSSSHNIAHETTVNEPVIANYRAAQQNSPMQPFPSVKSEVPLCDTEVTVGTGATNGLATGDESEKTNSDGLACNAIPVIVIDDNSERENHAVSAQDQSDQDAQAQEQLNFKPNSPSDSNLDSPSNSKAIHHFQKVSSQYDPSKVAKSPTRRPDGHIGTSVPTSLERQRPMRPSGMPTAGARDILHMLQRKLLQDEQHALRAVECSKQESLEQVRNLEHKQCIIENKVEVLKMEKEQLLAKTRHDQEQIQSLRKRSAVLENYVNGFSSDFNRLKEEVIKAQSTCAQLTEEKTRQECDRVELLEHFNVNLQKSKSLHDEANNMITTLQTRVHDITKEKEILEAALKGKVSLLAEQRDLCAQLQNRLGEVRELPGKLNDSVQSNCRTLVQKLDDLRASVEKLGTNDSIKATMSEFAESIRSLQDTESASLPQIEHVRGAVESLSER